MGEKLLMGHMSSFETPDKSANQTPDFHESVGGKLLADAQGWFAHQSPTAKTLEIAGAVTLGTAAVAFASRWSHAVEIVAKSAHLDAPLSQLEKQLAFASKEYLSSKYLITPELRETMGKLSGHLAQQYPEFNSVVVVGGQSNGSFVLRSMTKAHPGSDLDYYLIGHATTAQRLSGMAKEVQTAVKANNLVLDGVFNGRNPELYLNLSDLQHHIDNEDFNLMALPFRAAFGKPLAAQAKVLQVVIEHPRKTEIWQQMGKWHDETLSMHHGTWSLDFNNAIMQDYFPQKVEKFGLPETPELALKQLKNATDQP